MVKLNVFICDERGLQFSTNTEKKKICPRYDSTNNVASKIPDDKWSFVNEAINDEWAIVAKEKGLMG